VTDDGDNFVSDSRLDNDEQLAFYPRLRTVINRLSRYRGVLWVEPGRGPRARATLSRRDLPARRRRGRSWLRDARTRDESVTRAAPLRRRDRAAGARIASGASVGRAR